MSGNAVTDSIAQQLDAPLRALGLDVEAVELTPAGKRRVLRVAVDKDGGVTLDDVAEATREIDRVLDEASGTAGDAMGEQPYTLEVTSRGVDRPLTLPRHWRRNATRLVRATMLDGTTLTGRIRDWDEDETGGVTLDVEGGERAVAYADVKRALVQIEFSRPESGQDPDENDEAGDA